MLHYTQSTVFNAPTQAIVNTVNCLGVMGAGLALEFKLRFPDMYEDYRRKCKNKQIETGKLSIYKTKDKLLIINFPTKYNWRHPSKIEWIEQGLNDFVKHYQSWGIKSVAFPKLGCERGGLQWEKVKALMEKSLNHLNDIEIYICLDSKTEAEGIEKNMIQILQKTQLWINAFNINPTISQKIIDKLPKIKRFRHLQKISGVGKETYQNLFQLLYSLTQRENTVLEPQNTEEVNQNSLQFDFSVSKHSKVESESKYHDQSQVKLKSATPQLSVSTEIIKKIRIKLALLLYGLGLEVEEIRVLTWSHLIKQEDEKFIKVTQEKRISISEKVWEELQEMKNLQKVNDDHQLMISSLKKSKLASNNKPLAVSTIKDLIRKGKKMQSELQQLELFPKE